MKKFIFILLMILAFVLEAKIPVLGVRLNLTVIFVYYIGLKHGPSRGLLFGAFVGAMEDSIATGILGPCMLGKATVGFLSSFITGGLFIWTPLLGLVWLVALTMLDGMISFASLAIFSHQPMPFSKALLTVFLQGIINGPFGLIFKPKHDDQQ
jgi:cell shape-determining protein MreD